MTMQPRNLGGAVAGLVAGVLLMSFTGVGNLLARDGGVQSDAIVACGPNERIVTRQILANGQVQTIGECAPALAVQTTPIRNAALAPRTSAASRSVASAATAQEPASPERSWKKSALIIGGAAGTGAGIGGAVNGGKGALIGAAIGGGAAAIYEAIKRKDQ